MESVDLSSTERSDDCYWSERESLFNGPHSDVDASDGVHQGLCASTNPDQYSGNCNYTEVFLSIWNTDEEQTFCSEAERFVSTRRTCVAVWIITRLNVSLIDITYLLSANEIDVTDPQKAIANGTDDVQELFPLVLGEYDWKTRIIFDKPLPGSYGLSGPPQFFPVFNTRPALVAAMLWARITSVSGPERVFNRPFNSYAKSASDIGLAKQFMTLQRSPWLSAVLAIHPLLTKLAVLAKATLYTTPIGDGFGLISPLAGIREEGFEIPQGAALTGTLSEKVRVRFTARKAEGTEYERLHLDMASQAKSDRLVPKIKYG